MEKLAMQDITVAEVVRRLRRLDGEHKARQVRMAALGADTDNQLEQIKTTLAYVEEYLRSPLPDFYSLYSEDQCKENDLSAHSG